MVQTIEERRAKSRETYWNNRERERERVKKYNDAHRVEIREKARQRYQENKEVLRDRQKVYRSSPEQKARYKIYQQRKARENPGKYTHWSNFDKHRRNNRVPKWLTPEQKDEIQSFYEESVRKQLETGIRHSVDHIVPTNSPNVSGLHVPWNLQVITLEQNVVKGNKIIEDVSSLKKMTLEERKKYQRDWQNARYVRKTPKKTWVVTFPDGHEESVTQMSEFCRKYDLDKGNMSRVASGKAEHCENFRVREIIPS